MLSLRTALFSRVWVGHDILGATNRMGRTLLELSRHLGHTKYVACLEEVELGTLLPGMAKRKRQQRRAMMSPRQSPRQLYLLNHGYVDPEGSPRGGYAEGVGGGGGGPQEREAQREAQRGMMRIMSGMMETRPETPERGRSVAAGGKSTWRRQTQQQQQSPVFNSPGQHGDDDQQQQEQAPTLPQLVRMYTSTRGKTKGSRHVAAGARYTVAGVNENDNNDNGDDEEGLWQRVDVNSRGSINFTAVAARNESDNDEGDKTNDGDNDNDSDNGNDNDARMARSLFTMTFSKLPGLAVASSTAAFKHKARQGGLSRRGSSNPAAARARTDALMGVQFPSIAPQPKALRAAQRKCASEHRSKHLKAARDIRFVGYTMSSTGTGKTGASGAGGGSPRAHERSFDADAGEDNDGGGEDHCGNGAPPAVLGLTQAFDSSMLLGNE